MDLLRFLYGGLNIVGSFNVKIAALLFSVCLIGEAGLSVPYLLETAWLLAGYQISARVLSPVDLLLLVLMAQLGRQGGALVLYAISRTSSSWLEKMVKRIWPKIGLRPSPVPNLFSKINLPSPFAVALGRLLWLRVPLTMFLGAKRRLRTLLLGVALSSFIYDGTYILLGTLVGTTTKLGPATILVSSLAALTVLYGIIFAIRRLAGGLARRREKSVTSAAESSAADSAK